ncbi:hypothetical protein YT1_p10143 (plasmid) [Rhodococcus ruber]|nr:hypothetical protein YT1_p10143 [Rhodococcus ruber]
MCSCHHCSDLGGLDDRGGSRPGNVRCHKSEMWLTLNPRARSQRSIGYFVASYERLAVQ